ncbi:Uma2 family endonuclease [Candidatus Synechococcus calcipolaris G9]|uniref:Uma2 family endonuclease n=1 Tax=Candidatus Synechococcus calcipolaris G9 TaxID=1497997 RepID=A0ABT6EUL8_9SYNE|nr:Uma2 family endonuclease [Candidatus Synechococcus calcipolaris]MDG2989552.1 Uma2 family endonuclease [Candidatus Synechococcus calcipolaris G9]
MTIIWPPSSSLPPLETGDRLERHEFERRYAQMPEIKKAELINGVVYMASPLRYRQHGQPHSQINAWLQVYAVVTPCAEVADNATVRLDSYNEVQPDTLLRLDTAVGGQSRITPDDYLEGAPELIVEIASSSAAYDLHDKLEVYCRHGVQEYLVWTTQEPDFYWYVLQKGRYERQVIDGDYLKSQVFPGLWLDLHALLAGNIRQVLQVLNLGLASPEYQTFVQQLRQKTR